MEVFELLKSEGISDPASAEDRIRNLSNEEVEKLAKRIFEQVQSEAPTEVLSTTFSFTAGSTLCGGREPCSMIDCRLENMKRLTAFSALYADRLLIPNFFAYADCEPNESLLRHNAEEFRRGFYDDITILFNWEPLIQSSIVQFSKSNVGVCESCFQRKFNKERSDFEAELKSVKEKLSEKLLSEIKFTLLPDQTLEMSGARNYTGTEAISFYKLPPALEHYRKGRKHEFSKSEVRMLGLIESHVLSSVFNQVLTQKIFSVNPSLSYLTDRGLEADVINALNPNEDTERSKAMLEGLSHQIPIISTKDLDRNALEGILRIRESNHAAFEGYRYAIREVLGANSSFSSEGEYRSAIEQAVAPKLNEIDRAVAANSDFYSEKLGRQALFSAVTISMGLFCPPPLNLLGTMAGIYSAKDIYSTSIDESNPPIKARENSFYFLWQARNELRKSRSH